MGESAIPIERYISHLMFEVPFPSPSRPRILMELGNDMVAFENSDDSQFPLTGANFVDTLKCLGTENLIYAMLLTLLEQKILVHSLRPWLLASVTESFCALIFPFSWQLPYIPQCPLELSGIFHAPLSFMAGIDSRYFDLNEEPPNDVTCFDLDTTTISKSTVQNFIKLDILPKKPLKRLRTTLDALYIKIVSEKSSKGNRDKEKMLEYAIREAFLKFICALMDGYTDYLCPIMSCPQQDGVTDVQHLFSWDHFLKSRDKSAVEFYQKFRETTCFNRFIEERSGALMEKNVSIDRSIYYVFFDDSISRLRAVQYIANNKDKSSIKEEINGLRLFDSDSLQANRTVVVQSPQILNPEMKDHRFPYNSFPHKFSEEFFEKDFIKQTATGHPPQSNNLIHVHVNANFHVLRTRHEMRKSLADSSTLAEQNPLYWSRSILFYAYSVWFMQLPSMIVGTKNKRKMLLLGIRVLYRMEQLGLPFHDQICFRLLIQLCGEYNRPEMAINILRKMLQLGIVPNAITYKIYHQALLQSEWPSQLKQTAIKTWRRLQMRLEVISRFRLLLSQLELNDQDHHPPIPTLNTVSNESDIINDSNYETNNGEPIENNVHEIDVVEIKDEDNELKHAEIHSENESQIECYASFSDPLGAEMNNIKSALINKNGNPQPKNTITLPTQQSTGNLLKTTTVTKTNNPFLSPSREKFIKEHSASPFSGENKEASDNRSLNSEKRKRKSLNKLGSSWLKTIAANSPILNTLIPRSHTTDSLDRISRDSSVNSSEVQSASNSTVSASPNLFTLANKMRKKAMRTYNDVMGPATELLERTGLNPGRMINEAKLNLSKSYHSVDKSEMSAVSNQNLVDTSGDFFFLCTQRTKDLLPINYWMRDILPEDDTELRDVWIKKNQDGDESFSQEEFLDVMLSSSSICSNCEQLIYDDELTLGWSIDDANLNSICPRCQHNFLPNLKICISIRQPKIETESPKSMNDSSNINMTPSISGEVIQYFTVPYLSPLVLRREFERLLESDGPLVLSRPTMRITHPIIFWNVFYYCRRLELPTHLLTWVSPAVVIHCVQDMPELPNIAEENAQQNERD